MHLVMVFSMYSLAYLVLPSMLMPVLSALYISCWSPMFAFSLNMMSFEGVLPVCILCVAVMLSPVCLIACSMSATFFSNSIRLIQSQGLVSMGAVWVNGIAHH